MREFIKLLVPAGQFTLVYFGSLDFCLNAAYDHHKVRHGKKDQQA